MTLGLHEVRYMSPGFREPRGKGLASKEHDWLVILTILTIVVGLTYSTILTHK